MSSATPTDQLQVDSLALDYVRLHGLKVSLQVERERSERLQKSIMSAMVECHLGNFHRVKEILTQALT